MPIHQLTASEFINLSWFRRNLIGRIDALVHPETDAEAVDP